MLILLKTSNTCTLNPKNIIDKVYTCNICGRPGPPNLYQTHFSTRNCLITVVHLQWDRALYFLFVVPPYALPPAYYVPTRRLVAWRYNDGTAVFIFSHGRNLTTSDSVSSPITRTTRFLIRLCNHPTHLEIRVWRRIQCHKIRAREAQRNHSKRLWRRRREPENKNICPKSKYIQYDIIMYTRGSVQIRRSMHCEILEPSAALVCAHSSRII